MTGPRATPRPRLRAGVLVLVVAGLVAVAALLTPRGGDGDLGTADPGPGGSLALTRLLQANGVRVRPADSGAGALAAVVDPARTTVLVTRAGGVAADLARRLAGTGARLVLVAPGPAQLDAAAPGVRTAAADGDLGGDNRTDRTTTADRAAADRDAADRGGPGTAPACALPAARLAGPVDTAAGQAYTIDAAALEGDVATTCYPTAAGAALVALPAGGGRGPAVVVGTDALLRNSRLADGGVAALSLDLLGARPTLVWFRPAPVDALAPDATGRPLSEAVPGWVGPVVAMAVVAAVLAALARGRRIGPVVTERLPVVVAAGETTAGRARLYRRHRARDSAAGALRAATVQDLSARFGTGRAPAGPVSDGPASGRPRSTAAPAVPAGLVDVVAGRAGLPATVVVDLLGGPVPADDTALVRLDAGLADLRERTRRL